MTVSKDSKMQVIKGDTAFFDVDNTLILPLDNGLCTVGELVNVWDTVDKTFIGMQSHPAMIRLLLEEKHSGKKVIVWSRGREEWAQAAVEALGLTKQVDLVISKPLVYFDDLDVKEWLPYRVYLQPGTKYKK